MLAELNEEQEEILKNQEAFVRQNATILQLYGLAFLRMLLADSFVLSPNPSQTFAVIAALSNAGYLGERSLIDLLCDFQSLGIPPLTDEHGGSILRN